MEVSGTLHLYSGRRRELFFVFDDDIAQSLYGMTEFAFDDPVSRRVYISIGEQRFISQRTLSFSRKQTEIKISLCSLGSKDGLGALTALYDWYVPAAGSRPSPFPIVGRFSKVAHEQAQIWELWLSEPIGLVLPPGFARRRRTRSKAFRVWQERRAIVERDTGTASRLAEQIALAVAQNDFPEPEYHCLWRDGFYDSERSEIRALGVIADIDVWDEGGACPELFIEVKSQKVFNNSTEPRFYLSLAEWRSLVRCRKSRLPYQIWLVQYHSLEDLSSRSDRLRLLVFNDVSKDWLDPDGFLVRATRAHAKEYQIEW